MSKGAKSPSAPQRGISGYDWQKCKLNFIQRVVKVSLWLRLVMFEWAKMAPNMCARDSRAVCS